MNPRNAEPGMHRLQHLGQVLHIPRVSAKKFRAAGTVTSIDVQNIESFRTQSCGFVLPWEVTYAIAVNESIVSISCTSQSHKGGDRRARQSLVLFLSVFGAVRGSSSSFLSIRSEWAHFRSYMEDIGAECKMFLSIQIAATDTSNRPRSLSIKAPSCEVCPVSVRASLLFLRRPTMCDSLASDYALSASLMSADLF